MTTINIQLNGEAKKIDSPANITSLLQHAGLENRPLAVEVNREIIPRSLYAQHEIQDGDRIEIVHAIGGG